jgi:hypothetical protein
LPVAVVGKLAELVGDAWAALVVSVLVSFLLLIAIDMCDCGLISGGGGGGD